MTVDAAQFAKLLADRRAGRCGVVYAEPNLAANDCGYLAVAYGLLRYGPLTGLRQYHQNRRREAWAELGYGDDAEFQAATALAERIKAAYHLLIQTRHERGQIIWRIVPESQP